MLFEKIAVIDDDMRIHKSLDLALRQHNVVHFYSGSDALAYLKKPNDVRLVLLDVFMEGMDGLSVLSEIKKIDEKVAVVMMTGYGTKDIVIEALRHHADDFVEKPFDVEALNDKVKTILREKGYSTRVEMGKDEKIERIKGFIEKNRAMVSLQDIASEMCLSPKYVSRLFRKKTQKNFRKYKLNHRIKLAKNMLRDSSFSIGHIAEKLGYQNAESFMKTFKKIMECTPTQFRKTVRTPANKPLGGQKVSAS